MIPAITHVDSVEMIRDGGSLAAIFRGEDGCEYWLLFPIDQTHPAAGGWKYRGYLAPLILRRAEAAFEFPMTWEHALIYLDQIQRFPLDERSLYWYETMRKVAHAEGALPPEILALPNGSV